MNRNDVLLATDVTCYNCKRLVALSNAITWDGRYFCREACCPAEYRAALALLGVEHG